MTASLLCFPFLIWGVNSAHSHEIKQSCFPCFPSAPISHNRGPEFSSSFKKDSSGRLTLKYFARGRIQGWLLSAREEEEEDVFNYLNFFKCGFGEGGSVWFLFFGSSFRQGFRASILLCFPLLTERLSSSFES